MPHYPGQQPRRWPYAVLAVVVAAGAGLLVGRATADGSTGAAATTSGGGTTCPGGRDAPGRNAAAVCLVQAYFALENVAAAQRDSKLANLIRSDQLDGQRKAYKALDAKVATEYTAVAATKLQPSQTLPDTDASGQAWVAFVDNYKDGSPPLAQWWLTSFELHWQNGRWWLAGPIGTQVNATPTTAAAAPAPGTGFGPGWVAAGGS
ncbi:MAG TPA: hypothetical protein VGL39_00345 [Jatrophihabitantaceae bacterium]|jgi:hypothetical protein